MKTHKFLLCVLECLPLLYVKKELLEKGQSHIKGSLGFKVKAIFLLQIP